MNLAQLNIVELVDYISQSDIEKGYNTKVSFFFEFNSYDMRIFGHWDVLRWEELHNFSLKIWNLGNHLYYELQDSKKGNQNYIRNTSYSRVNIMRDSIFSDSDLQKFDFIDLSEKLNQYCKNLEFEHLKFRNVFQIVRKGTFSSGSTILQEWLKQKGLKFSIIPLPGEPIFQCSIYK